MALVSELGASLYTYRGAARLDADDDRGCATEPDACPRIALGSIELRRVERFRTVALFSPRNKLFVFYDNCKGQDRRDLIDRLLSSVTPSEEKYAA